MKLIGYLDGVEAKFNFYPPNTFKAEIPKKMNGIYIVELHAIDDAGNQTNISNIAVLIDFDKLTFKVINSGLIYKESSSEYGYTEFPQEFGYKELI